MYIRKTGYVVGPQVVPDLNTERTKLKDGSHKVMKIGCVLTRQEEKFGLLHKGVDIAAIANRGLDYYQVNSSQGACERCMIHNGAIYPVVEAKEGDNLPPFHPNCLCSIVGIGTVNPHDDPWLAETICWLDIMYGDGTFELKAQKLIDFYSWSEFSVDYIADILSSIDDISHIGRRIDTFFTRLNETSQSGNGLPSNVSDTGLVLLKLLEGFSGGAYSGVDSQNQTIGYGHVVRLGENFSNGLTEAQATELLKQDLKKFQTMLGHFVKANNLNLSQNQYDALLLFSYQQGEYVWGRDDYDFIQLLKSGEWTDEQIIYEMGRFDRSGATHYEGLWKRHMNEALLFITGEYRQYELDELEEMGYTWPGKVGAS